MSGELELVLPGGTIRRLLMTDLGVGDDGHSVRSALLTARADQRGTRLAMTPDEWEWLERFADARSVHAPGAHYTVERDAIAMAHLSRRIDRELERYGAHPAFKGLAAMGHHREVLCAWSAGDCRFTTYRRIPSPLQSIAQRGELWPRRLVHHGRVITRWEWRPRGDVG